MKVLDIDNWSRKQLYEHFTRLADPTFAVTVKVDVTAAYDYAKAKKVSFFGKYLHDCIKAINAVENLRYRIIDDKVVLYDTIHASATIMREDKTFGFSFINYDEDLLVFLNNLKLEKERILSTTDLYPPVNSLDCIHCSAIPWIAFTGHKEPRSGQVESVPELAFSKVELVDGKRMMNVAISVNHALVDGYHVGLFFEKFQNNLNSLE
ncbi:CatA-like O-acetyltransferase [Winogradskyella sp. 3972H.M.0a.05]|uniref:CatA-like O-acetyltransferase n=1 Tax=Winogradskyella sp. 3972H.M.0a.05 TaxID=2950277 RepID=UPI0033996787